MTTEKFGNKVLPRTAYKKGEKRIQQGRPKGCLNKNNQAIRDMIKAALDEAGGVDYLVERAHDPKTAGAFLGLIGKVLPMQLTGVDDNAIQHVVKIELVAMNEDAD